MNRKKLLIVIGILTIFLLTACKKEDIDLSFIKVPDRVSLMSSIYNDEIQSLNEEWKKIQHSNDSETKEKLTNKMIEYSKAATLEVKDEEFIKTVFAAVTKEKASVWNNYDNSYVDMPYFVLSINISPELIKDEYLASVSIFEDGLVFLHIYKDKSDNIPTLLKVKLTKSDYEYVQRYFDEHKGK